MRIQIIFGILWIFTQTAMGLLLQDPVVCSFTDSNQCYVALGQQLHLTMPQECGLFLAFTDRTSTTYQLLKYKKEETPTLHSKWQFVNDNKTVILSSAERSDSGTYILFVHDEYDRIKGLYKLQLNIEGLLLRDPVVCGYNDSNQCYLALGQRLHLLMPQEYGLTLTFTDRTFKSDVLLRYRRNSKKHNTRSPRWKFVNDNKTMILSSAESSDSGTYTLEIVDKNETTKGDYNLQLNVEAQVSSVKISSSCLSPGVIDVSCSADGDNLDFSWTTDLNPKPQLVDGAGILYKTWEGYVTCHVENHVSREHSTTKLNTCEPVNSVMHINNGFMVFVSVWLFEVIILMSLLVGAFYIYTRIYRKLRTPDNQEVL